MKKLASLIAASAAFAVTAPAALALDVERNERLYDAAGSSIAKVQQVANDGDVLVIYKGKVRRIQSETLSKTDGKLTTSLSKKEIRRLN